MTIYLVVPLLVTVAIIQSTIVSHFHIWGVFADLPLLVVTGWGLMRGSRDGLIWGFVAGVAVDLFSGAPFGAATFGMMAVGALAGLGQSTVFRSQLLWPPVAVGLATIVYDLLFLLVLWIAGYGVSWLETSLYRIAPSAALNAAVTPIIFGIMRWLNTRFGREGMEW